MSILHFLRSTGAVYLDKYFGVLASLAVSVYLARVLTPDEIGVNSLALAVVGIGHMFRDMGLASYIRNAPVMGLNELRRCLGASYLTTGFSAVCLVMLAFPLGRLYGDDRLVWVVLILAINLLTIPSQTITTSFWSRGLKLLDVSFFNIFSVSLFSVLACFFASRGHGYLSTSLATAATNLLCLFYIILRAPPSIPWLPNFRGVLDVIKVSRWPFSVMLVNYGSERSPQFLISKFNGFSAAAYFDKAASACDLVKIAIVDPFGSFVGPLSIRIREYHGESIHREFISFALGLVGVTLVLAFTSVWIVSAELIHFLFGKQWDSSISILRLMTFVGPLIGMNVVLLQIAYSRQLFKPVALGSSINKLILIAGVFVLASYDFTLTPFALGVSELIQLAFLLFMLRRYLAFGPIKLTLLAGILIWIGLFYTSSMVRERMIVNGSSQFPLLAALAALGLMFWSLFAVLLISSKWELVRRVMKGGN